MIEIRVLGRSQKEVEAWFRLVFKLAGEEAGASEIRWRNVMEGRAGDYLGYIKINPPLLAGQPSAPRLPRKSRQLARRRRRASG